jgi:hypothetical protein
MSLDQFLAEAWRRLTGSAGDPRPCYRCGRAVPPREEYFKLNRSAGPAGPTLFRLCRSCAQAQIDTGVAEAYAECRVREYATGESPRWLCRRCGSTDLLSCETHHTAKCRGCGCEAV